ATHEWTVARTGIASTIVVFCSLSAHAAARRYSGNACITRLADSAKIDCSNFGVANVSTAGPATVECPAQIDDVQSRQVSAGTMTLLPPMRRVHLCSRPRRYTSIRSY